MYLKQILSILIAAITLITSSRGIICWLEYKLNYNYIIKNLCVERNNPKNCCQGKCHLKQNLNNNEDDKENSADKLPYLRIKFDENTNAIIEFKQTFNFWFKCKEEMDSINEDKIKTDKDKPPSPPPKKCLFFQTQLDI